MSAPAAIAPTWCRRIAARVKARLKIRNPHTVAFDLIFGCPGWLQGVIQADYMIRSGNVQRIMVIGADTLSRISDPHDRDSLIYADGAGAVILEGRHAGEEMGILAHAVRSDTLEHSGMLFMGESYKEQALEALFLKMEGRKLYKYALNTVAIAMKEALDCAGIDLRDIRKVLLHQANGKMDEAILSALCQLYGIETPPEDLMPMTISWLGNSSVATLPTMLDLICKGEMPRPHHRLGRQHHLRLGRRRHAHQRRGVSVGLREAELRSAILQWSPTIVLSRSVDCRSAATIASPLW